MSARPPSTVSFGRFVADARAAGRLVVQPRMGFGSATRMRTGLSATKSVAASTVGTVTLDSYTRLGDHSGAWRALSAGAELNGYPIVAHDAETTRAMISGILDETFPIQVRHGSPCPERIFRRMCDIGLTASEGGPVSYCLPYGRTPLAESRRSWQLCCELLAGTAESGVEPHLETFGGCLLGQLCPPSLLIAISLLEGMFFRQNGLRSISLSYAQQASRAQDEEALQALRRLATGLLSDVDWHVVLYTYMGVFPRTVAGAAALLAEAAGLAVRAGADRLVVKTAAESMRIPTIAENVAALEHAAFAAERAGGPARGGLADTGIHTEAQAIVEAVLDLDDDVGRALESAFRLGYLDVPYCLHPDNAGRASSYLDRDGRLQWRDTGRVPVDEPCRGSGRQLRAAELLDCLSRVRRRFDREPVQTSGEPTLAGQARWE